MGVATLRGPPPDAEEEEEERQGDAGDAGRRRASVGAAVAHVLLAETGVAALLVALLHAHVVHHEEVDLHLRRAHAPHPLLGCKNDNHKNHQKLDQHFQIRPTKPLQRPPKAWGRDPRRFAS